MPDAGALRRRFAELHRHGTFIVANVWDLGSARLFESLGFEAVATTSSGLAASLGRLDQQVTFEETVGFVTSLCRGIGLPVSVDSEYGFSETIHGIDGAVARLESTGASGISIEDYIPGRGVLEIAEAVERAGRMVDAARGSGMVVTARAENHLYGIADLDDTIARLRAYADVGADCVYAPGLAAPEDIREVVDGVGAPVNTLLLPDGPGIPELAGLGVRRVSVGGSLAFTAYGAAARGASELLERGTMGYADGALSRDDRSTAFGDARPNRLLS